MARSRLTVRIRDGWSDRHVTQHVTGLKFKKTAPGGHHSASCTINLPRSSFPTLGPVDRMFIYDASTAATIWDGYTSNPGSGDGVDGEAFEVSAAGGMTRVADERQSLVYIDGDLGGWARGSLAGIPASATTDATTDPMGAASEGLLMQFANGNPVGTGSIANMGYTLNNTDMELGAFSLTAKAGKTDAGYKYQYATSGGLYGSDTFDLGTSASTVPLVVNRWVGEPGHFLATRKNLALRLTRVGGATNVADDLSWGFFYNVRVVGRRMTTSGALLTGAAGLQSTSYVRADWVVADLIGRVLSMCDAATAVVEATTAQIDQLAYRDAVTAAQVLDDLTLYEPDFLWEMLETLPNGLHRFQYRGWPTVARYEVSTRDGYSAPGGDVDLCNRVAVEWTDTRGNQQTTICNSYVEALASAGITRDAEKITLPAGRGSLVNAANVGHSLLASLAGNEKAATVTVRRPIMDMLRNRMVQPWEIEPGYMVRVRETGDLLRLTEMDYDDDSATSVLTLGTPVLSMEQRIAKLAITK